MQQIMLIIESNPAVPRCHPGLPSEERLVVEQRWESPDGLRGDAETQEGVDSA
jgi:hypothetical protein